MAEDNLLRPHIESVNVSCAQVVSLVADGAKVWHTPDRARHGPASPRHQIDRRSEFQSAARWRFVPGAKTPKVVR